MVEKTQPEDDNDSILTDEDEAFNQKQDTQLQRQTSSCSSHYVDPNEMEGMISTIRSFTIHGNMPDPREGFLEKFSPALFLRWQKRYVTLSMRTLKYYKNNELMGVLNFDLYQVKLKTNEEKHEFSLQVEGSERVFQFKAGSQIDFFLWVTALQTHIKTSKGVKNHIMAPPLETFWRHEPISEEQFIANADTFDILMFRCKSTGAKLQRSFTWNDYDHIGMILRFDSKNPERKNEVYILEATGNLGVAIKKWSHLRDSYGEFYERIVLRHIQMDRTAQQLKMLAKMLKEACGRSYYFRPRQLMRRDTIQKPKKNTDEQKLGTAATAAAQQQEEDEDLLDKDRGFFCSELAVKVLKVCGIMADTQVASSSFLPGDFTSKKDKIKLVDTAKWTNEQFIMADFIDIEKDKQEAKKLSDD